MIKEEKLKEKIHAIGLLVVALVSALVISVSAAAATQITPVVPRYTNNLSGEEKQRVAVARALINSPKYILADEPTGTLDSKNTSNLVEILRKISQNGVGVVIVTHDKNVSSECDVVWEMKDGKIV